MDLDNDGEMGDGAWEAGRGAARQPGTQRLQIQKITDGSHQQREREARGEGSGSPPETTTAAGGGGGIIPWGSGA